MPVRRSLVGLVAVLLAVLVVWWAGDDPGAPTSPEVTSSTGPTSGERDPESGLTWVALPDLPPEVADTVALVDAGGPYPYDRDGVTFQNREGILPRREPGYYREFTVPTPGSDDRGARRIVAGDGGELYYTDDHYESFRRIAP